MLPLVLGLVGIIVVILATVVQRRRHLRFCKEDDPTALLGGPWPMPLVGSVWLMLREGGVTTMHRVLHAISPVYGNLYMVWLGISPFVVVHDLQMVKEVLHSPTSAKNYEKGMFAEIMRPLLGQGLLLSEGDIWREHHRLVAPAFQPSHYRNALPGMIERTAALLNKWRKYADSKQQLEICEELSRLTLDNIGVMAFGQHFNAIEDSSQSHTDNSIYADVSVILREMQKRCIQLVPLYEYFPFRLLPSQTHFAQANDKIHRIVRRLLKERREAIMTTNSASGERRKYLLDVLIEGQENSGFPDTEVEDELITTIMGGHETTASSLSFLVYLLVTHPDKLRLVTDELQRIRDSKARDEAASSSPTSAPGVEWTFEDLQQMDYLQNVVKEGLRLYPSAPILNRRATKDVVLGGYHIPAQTEILIAPWVLQRHPQYWDKPDEFIPERWADDRTGSAREKDSSLSFLAFSAGSRKCLGQQFAYMEAKLAVASIFSNYELALVSGQKVETEMAITLRFRYGLTCTLRPTKASC